MIVAVLVKKSLAFIKKMHIYHLVIFEVLKTLCCPVV